MIYIRYERISKIQKLADALDSSTCITNQISTMITCLRIISVQANAGNDDEAKKAERIYNERLEIMKSLMTDLNDIINSL